MGSTQSFGDLFNGDIGRMAIFNRALSDIEISQITTFPAEIVNTFRDDLVEFWTMDEASTTQAYGYYGHHITLQNGPAKVALLPTVLMMTPSPLDFGSEFVGSSRSAFLSVTNVSGASVSISIAYPSGGDFSVVVGGTTCLTSIPNGNSCVIEVAFAPTVTGVQNSELLIVSDAGNFSTTLTGYGQPYVDYDAAVESPGLGWDVSGDAFWFDQTGIWQTGGSSLQSGPVGDGLSSELSTVVAGPASISFWWKVSSETGYDYLTVWVNGIEKARVSGEMDWAPVSLNLPDSNNTVTWSYSKDGSVSEGADAGWIDNVSIGTPLPLEMTPSALDFGWGYVGEGGYSQMLTLTNLSASATAINSIHTTDASFGVASHTCGASLAPASSCVIEVFFSPLVTGPLSGMLVVETDNVAMPQITAALVGNGEGDNGEGGLITIEPSVEYHFGSQPVGATVHQTFTLYNDFEATLFVEFMSGRSDFFVSSHTCGSGIPMFGSCTVTVGFTPSYQGWISTELSILIDGQFTQAIYLSGEGAEEAEPSVTAFAATPTSVVSVSTATDKWNSGASMGSVTHTLFFVEKVGLFETGGQMELAALMVPGYSNSLDLGNAANWTGYLPSAAWFTPLALPLQTDTGYRLHVVYYNASAEALQTAFSTWNADGPPATQYIVGEKTERLYLEVGYPPVVFGRDVELDAEISNGDFTIRAEFDPAKVDVVTVTIGGNNYELTSNQQHAISSYATYPEGQSLSVSVLLLNSSNLFYEFALPMKNEIDPHLSASLSGIALGLNGSVLNLSFGLNQTVWGVDARAELYRGASRVDESYLERWGGVGAGSHTLTALAESLFWDIQPGDEIRVVRVNASNNVGILQVQNQVEGAWSVVYQGPSSAFSQAFGAGWNLAAVPYDQALTAARLMEKGAYFNAVWVMREGQWHALAGNATLQAVLNGMGIPQIAGIEPGEGFWIQAKSAFNLSYVDAGSYSLLTQNRLTAAGAGWHLLGSGSDITPAQVVSAQPNAQIIWGFQSGQWRVFSPSAATQSHYTDRGVSVLTNIAQGDGLWVKVQ
ncbi:MAG: choice-of-anchor D domain-containing protein [Campylobacterales bacterium]